MSSKIPQSLSELTKEITKNGLLSKKNLHAMSVKKSDKKLAEYFRLNKMQFMTQVFTNPKGGITNFERDNFCKTYEKAICAGYRIQCSENDNTEFYELGVALNNAVVIGDPSPSQKNFITIEDLMLKAESAGLQYVTKNPIIYSPLTVVNTKKIENRETVITPTGFHKLTFKFNIEYTKVSSGKKDLNIPQIRDGNIIKVDNADSVYSHLTKNGTLDGYSEDNITPLQINEKHGIPWKDVNEWLGYGANSKIFFVGEIQSIQVVNVVGQSNYYISPILKILTMFVEQIKYGNTSYAYLGSFSSSLKKKQTTEKQKQSLPPPKKVVQTKKKDTKKVPVKKTKESPIKHSEVKKTKQPPIKNKPKQIVEEPSMTLIDEGEEEVNSDDDIENELDSEEGEE